MTATPSTDGHHPGPPRFVQVGERIVDPIFVDAEHGFDRDDLAPWVDGTPERDPDAPPADAFSWDLVERPAASTARVEHAPTPYEGDVVQYDSGRHDVVGLTPDVAGTYVLALDAPDGTHHLTVEALPEPPESHLVDEHSPPRLTLDGRYDDSAGEFVLEADATLAPDSYAPRSDLRVEYLPHDAAAIDADDVETATAGDGATGTVARVPADALDGPTSVYAAPFDGRALGVTDEAVLDPDAGEVRLPNRPPAWLDDAVVYEVFTRSFAGEADATDFALLESKVPYLADLGVDVVWLTPIVPAWSADVEDPPGGPHGYSTGDYFDVADDLGTLAGFRSFVDACHDHDLRVVFDLVVNHCGWTHDYFQDTVAETREVSDDRFDFPNIEAWDDDSKYFDWFDRRADAGDHDAAPAQTSFFDVRLQPNLNYGNLALREHILAVVDFWSDIVDGFRCDIAWGVPHSFWTEVRTHVKEKDEAFLLLDESVPRVPAFAESEFDLHFDTRGFMETAHAVARGERPARDLVDAVEARRRDGFPEHTRLLNAIENHDESRLYHEAKAEGDRDDPAAAQRAAAAAAFTLPGVPFLYYGEERLVAEHGERRPAAFPDDPQRTDDVEDDPYKRAFVNWEEYPADHLQFYRDLVAFYESSPVLGPTADLVHAAYRTDHPDDVLVFGRRDGDERRVVVVNFAGEERPVDLRPVVDTVDRISGEDVGVAAADAPADATRVAVDTVAVLETPTLFGQGR